MTAVDVARLCRHRGIELTAAGGRLRYRAPAGAVDAEVLSMLSAHKAELLLLAAPCPGCGRPLDAGRCWWCHHRVCEACRERPTGSAYLALCLPCDLGGAGSGQN